MNCDRRSYLVPIIAVLLFTGCASRATTSVMEDSSDSTSKQWSTEKAWQWYNKIGPIRGCNYLPRTVINTTEQWQAETFQGDIIDQEMGWAADAGFNSMRVFLQYLVWKDDPQGLKSRMDEFMRIADRHGISTMWVLFDDCAFSVLTEPYLGKQGDTEPSESRWTPSPGHKAVTDRTMWPDLERYIKDIVGTFRNDKRVLLWDVYNEPGNSGMGDKSLPLVEASFKWTRQCDPTQPLTAGVWWSDIERALPKRQLELSDIVSFHSYMDPDYIRNQVSACQAFGRPVMCTEFLWRRKGNSFVDLLPIFSEHRVGWYNWGLVAGRNQAYLWWGTKKDGGITKWMHDFLYPNGIAYDPEEVELIRNFKFPDKVKTIVPTSEKEPQSWSYSLNIPSYGWHQRKFDETKGIPWRKGQGGFGVKGRPHTTVRTQWSLDNIWLRKMFELDEENLVNPHLRVCYDKDAEVYINGELAAKLSGYQQVAYELVPLSQRARAALKKGQNVIAVHAHKPIETLTAQFIDVGIVDIVTSGASKAAAADESKPVKVDPGTPWSKDKVWAWYKNISPIKGCSYIPRTAVNTLEMWQKETFDPATIDQELGWAQKAGYNSVQVFLPYAVWQDQPHDFMDRLDEFLTIADKHGISCVPVLFDDVCLSGKLEPVLGKQDKALVGVFNGGWLPSPGYSMVLDRSQWPDLEKYVKTIASRYKNDKRVLIWNVYNKPGPYLDSTTSFPLAKAALGWIRQVNPTQPVTVSAWENQESKQFLKMSDVVSIDDYNGNNFKEFFTDCYRNFKRPIIVTDFLMRTVRENCKDRLALFAEYNVGWYNWGLVAGRTQNYHFIRFTEDGGTPKAERLPSYFRPTPLLQIHDIFWPDGTPNDQEEIELIQNFRFSELPHNLF